VPSRVQTGEPVPVTLRARNTGTEPVDLYLRGREIAFDITVIRNDGEIVWRRLEGRTVPAILQMITLGPGELLELTEVWDQQSNAGKPVGPGLYTIQGTFPTDSRQPAKTPAVVLRIVP
jgi:hypothetical protein